MGDDQRPAPRVPFTQLGQVDSDFALAKTLQEQERAFMMLGMNRDGDAEENSDSDDDEHDNGDDEDFVVDDGTEDGEQDWLLEDLGVLEDSDNQDIGEENGPDQELSYEEENGPDQELSYEEENGPDQELSYEDLIALGEVVGTERRGLSTDEITSLPSSTYKFQPKSDSFNQCVICQSDYEEGEAMVVLPCNHPYHSECISKWLQLNRVCPICGVEVASSTRG